MAVELPSQSEIQKSKIYVELIRILFAIVLGQSFILLTRSTNDGGYREWFAAPAANFQGLFTLLLAYSLVITSFVGYNESTAETTSPASLRPRSYPIRKPPRFIIDIILLFLYYILFAFSGNFQTELITYFCIFGLYFAWNIFRLFEYWKAEGAKRALATRTTIASVFFAFFVTAYFVFTSFQTQIAGFQMFLLVPILIAFILYRTINPLSRRERRTLSQNGR